MTAHTIKQQAFVGGRVSAQLLSRHDTAKVAEGALTLNNIYIPRYGAATSRPGTLYLDTMNYQSCVSPWNGSFTYFPGNTISFLGSEYVCLAQGSASPLANPSGWTSIPASAPVRLIKFVFNYTTSYLLVFSVNNIRVYKNGVQVAVALSQMTAYSGATTYQVGDIVSYVGAGYICQAPNTHAVTPGSSTGQQPWKAMVDNGAGNYLLDIPVNYTAGSASTTGNYMLALPQGSLASLQVANLNDVMTVVGQQFAPFQLTRTSDIAWRITPFIAGAALAAPTGVSAVAGTNPSGGASPPSSVVATGGDGAFAKDTYVVCSAGVVFISGPSAIAVSSVGKADAANPVTLSWTNSGTTAIENYLIYKLISGSAYGFIGNTTGPNGPFVDSGITPNGAMPPPALPSGTITFTYVVTAVSSTDGSESLASSSSICIGGTPTDATPNVITWTPVTGASSYNIYSIVNGIPGLIGISLSPTFSDTNIQPNYSVQPPIPYTNADGSLLFQSFGNFPGVVAYFQQRLFLASTVNLPTTVWFSRVGTYNNFNVPTPIVDSGPLEFVIAQDEAQGVIAILDLQKLVIMTGAYEYVCFGNQFNTVTPTAVTLQRHGTNGCRLPLPVVIGNTALYVQSGGNQIRDFRFDIRSYTYTGDDLTVYNADLFQNATINDMAWQKLKDSIVWCAMSNGALYGLTYDQSQNIKAWHTHASGRVENVAVVQEGVNQTLYLTTTRIIGGATVRYLEKLTQREYNDTVLYSDFVGSDCSLVYDGHVTDASTVTATTGTTWAQGQLITLTASVAHFAASDVTNQNTVVMQLLGPTGLVTDQVTFQIFGYTSTTVVTAYCERDVPTWAQSAISVWGKGLTVLTGMTQLIGQSLAIVGDGQVIASPLNTTGPGGSNPYPPIVVNGSGQFTIPQAALVVIAGVPYQCDGQLVPLENSQGETILNKHVVVRECTPIFYNTNGGQFGYDQNHLLPWNQPAWGPPPNKPSSLTWGQPIVPYTGPKRVPVSGDPVEGGGLWFRQQDPLPFSISGVIVTFEVGEG